MSRYLPTDDDYKESAETRLAWLIAHKRPIELKDLSKGSVNQNRYLHAAIGYYGAMTGYTAGEAKRLFFKQAANPEQFVRTRYDELLGREVTYLRSITELTQAELSTCIERFRNWSAQEAGVYIPSGDEYIHILAMEQEIERAKRFL